MAPKQTPRTGFARKGRTSKNNMTIEEILGGTSEHLVAAVSYYAALCGAYLAQGTNRARSGVYWLLKLDDEQEKLWANSPEEANIALADLNELLVQTAIERGFLKAPETN